MSPSAGLFILQTTPVSSTLRRMFTSGPMRTQNVDTHTLRYITPLHSHVRRIRQTAYTSYTTNNTRRIILYSCNFFVYTQQNNTLLNNKMAPHQQLLIRRVLAENFFSQPDWAHRRVYTQLFTFCSLLVVMSYVFFSRIEKAAHCYFLLLWNVGTRLPVYTYEILRGYKVHACITERGKLVESISL